MRGSLNFPCLGLWAFFGFRGQFSAQRLPTLLISDSRARAIPCKDTVGRVGVEQGEDSEGHIGAMRFHYRACITWQSCFRTAPPHGPRGSTTAFLLVSWPVSLFVWGFPPHQPCTLLSCRRTPTNAWSQVGSLAMPACRGLRLFQQSLWSYLTLRV